MHSSNDENINDEVVDDHIDDGERYEDGDNVTEDEDEYEATTDLSPGGSLALDTLERTQEMSEMGLEIQNAPCLNTSDQVPARVDPSPVPSSPPTHRSRRKRQLTPNTDVICGECYSMLDESDNVLRCMGPACGQIVSLDLIDKRMLLTTNSSTLHARECCSRHKRIGSAMRYAGRMRQGREVKSDVV